MRTHDVLDAVTGVSEADSSVDTPSLRVTVDDQQADLALDGRDASRQLVVLALLHAGVVHLQDSISFQQSAAVGWRSAGHLTRHVTAGLISLRNAFLISLRRDERSDITKAFRITLHWFTAK